MRLDDIFGNDRMYFLRSLKLFGKGTGSAGLLRLLVGMLFRQKNIRVRDRKSGDTLQLRPTQSDWVVYVQVYLTDQFRPPPGIEVRSVLDGGANVGLSARMFRKHFPEARIVTAEPDADAFAQLRRNTADIDNATHLNIGLWSSDGHVKLLDPSQPSWSRQFVMTTEDDAAGVEGLSIPTVLRGSGVERFDLVKLDIEGAERALFEPERIPWLDSVGCVLIETHGAEADTLVCERLERHGFHVDRQGEKVIGYRRELP